MRVSMVMLLLVLSAPVLARWEAEPVPEVDGALHATVSTPSGERLVVRRTVEDQVLGTFFLGPGFDEFREGACPSFSVDDEPPINLGQQAAPCVVAGPRATFRFGEVDAGALISPLVLQLMNGRELTLRYPLEHRGYRETRFVLRGSKQALSEAIGQGVDVLGAAP